MHTDTLHSRWTEDPVKRNKTHNVFVLQDTYFKNCLGEFFIPLSSGLLVPAKPKMRERSFVKTLQVSESVDP